MSIAGLVLILCLICLIVSWYVLIRNEEVCKFQLELIDASYNVMNEYLNTLDPDKIDDDTFDKGMEKYRELYEIYDSICNLSYDKMLFSLKPLKANYWLTEEQINFLNMKF